MSEIEPTLEEIMDIATGEHGGSCPPISSTPAKVIPADKYAALTARAEAAEAEVERLKAALESARILTPEAAAAFVDAIENPKPASPAMVALAAKYRGTFQTPGEKRIAELEAQNARLAEALNVASEAAKQWKENSEGWEEMSNNWESKVQELLATYYPPEHVQSVTPDCPMPEVWQIRAWLMASDIPLWGTYLGKEHWEPSSGGFSIRLPLEVPEDWTRGDVLYRVECAAKAVKRPFGTVLAEMRAIEKEETRG